MLLYSGDLTCHNLDLNKTQPNQSTSEIIYNGDCIRGKPLHLSKSEQSFFPVFPAVECHRWNGRRFLFGCHKYVNRYSRVPMQAMLVMARRRRCWAVACWRRPFRSFTIIMVGFSQSTGGLLPWYDFTMTDDMQPIRLSGARFINCTDREVMRCIVEK